MNSTKESNFESKIKQEAKYNDWQTVYKYLASGLAAKRNYEGSLTAEIFYENFYVKSSEHIVTQDTNTRKTVLDKIMSMHRNRNNVILLTAHGGSGKSIFVHLLPHLFKENSSRLDITKFQTVDIDFEDSSSHWWNKLLKDFNSFLSCDHENRKIENYHAFKSIFNYYLDSCIINYSTLSEMTTSETVINDVLKKIKTTIYKNIQICNAIHGIFTPEILGTYESISNISATIQAVVLIFILFLISKDVYFHEKNVNKINDNIYSTLDQKYFIIFDNIEVFDTDGVKNIAKIIQDAHTLCHDKLMGIDNSRNLYNYFREKYTFICAMRTSTFNLTYETLHSGLETTGNTFEHIDLPYCDIFQHAILKKFNYLKKLHLENSALYKNLEIIINFIFNKDAVKKNEKKVGNEQSIVDLNSNKALKVFIEKNYVAFFNNDIRRAIFNLTKILDREEKNTKIIENLLAENKKDDLNGARQIIFRQIFDQVQEEVFSEFGFEKINPKYGREKYSATRLILAYLKWQKIAYPKRRISLKDLLDQIFGVGLYDEKQIANWIYTISNIVACRPYGSELEKDAQHYELISQKWSSLIRFSKNLTKETLEEGINEYSAVDKKDNIRINGHTISNITVELTAAGKCAINYVSVQYEFFAARLDTPYQALYCYTDFSNPYSDLFNCIDDVFHAIEHYAKGMLGRCPCYYGNDQSIYNGACVYRDSNNSEDPKDIVVCGYFIRLQEILSILRQTISYLDRYRLHVIKSLANHNPADNSAEIKLLLNIKKYCSIYDYIDREEYMKEKCDIIEKSHLNTNNHTLRNFYKYINNENHANLIDSKYYYYYKTKTGEIRDLLGLAIDVRLERLGHETKNKEAATLKAIYEISKEYDKLSLYDLCNKIKKHLES